MYLTSKKTCSLFVVPLQQPLRVYDSKVPSDTKCKPLVDIRWLNWTITSSLFTILNHPKGGSKNYALPIRKVTHILDTSWNQSDDVTYRILSKNGKNPLPVPPTYRFFNMGIFQIFGENPSKSSTNPWKKTRPSLWGSRTRLLRGLGLLGMFSSTLLGLQALFPCPGFNRHALKKPGNPPGCLRSFHQRNTP